MSIAVFHTFKVLRNKSMTVIPLSFPLGSLPRSGQSGHILIRSTPEKFKKHAQASFNNISHKAMEDRIVFLKSWNEWAEGNYMEPDLKFGKGYLKALKEAIQDVFYH